MCMQCVIKEKKEPVRMKGRVHLGSNGCNCWLLASKEASANQASKATAEGCAFHFCSHI